MLWLHLMDELTLNQENFHYIVINTLQKHKIHDNDNFIKNQEKIDIMYHTYFS